MKIFIGYDPRESISAWVLAHSIQKRASSPISITLLNLRQLELNRPYNEHQSTEFAFSRFLVPHLCCYSPEPVVFMDCDMLCLSDITEIPMQAGKAVTVVMHDYDPAREMKMDGIKQTKYPRKNWSSLMVFNPSLCRNLTPDVVNATTGLYLHRFQWLRDEDIGRMGTTWNFLVGEYPVEDVLPNIIHWTNGGPWMEGYEKEPYADLWFREYEEMTGAGS